MPNHTVKKPGNKAEFTTAQQTFTSIGVESTKTRFPMDYDKVVLGACFKDKQIINDLEWSDFTYAPDADENDGSKSIRRGSWNVVFHEKSLTIYHDQAGTFPVIFLQRPSLQIDETEGLS